MMTANGLAKLIEECGELIQIAGKRLAYFSTDEHPDGAGSLKGRLEDEIGDVMAACNFAAEANGLDRPRIHARVGKKLVLFHEWHAADDNNRFAVQLPSGSAAQPAPASRAVGEPFERLTCAQTSSFEQDNRPCYVCGRKLVAEPVQLSLKKAERESLSPEAIEALQNGAEKLARTAQWDRDYKRRQAVGRGSLSLAPLATPSAPVSEPAGAASPDVAKMVEEAKRAADVYGITCINESDEIAKDIRSRRDSRTDLHVAIDALGAAATQARAAAPALAREPLSREELIRVWPLDPNGRIRSFADFEAGARFAERFHGITADSARAAASEPLSVSVREVKP